MDYTVTAWPPIYEHVMSYEHISITPWQ